MNFQTPATEIMNKIVDLHHDIVFFLIIILVFVLYMLLQTVFFFNRENGYVTRIAFTHHEKLEQ
jgi:cytochrome c oxidase subunit 2